MIARHTLAVIDVENQVEFYSRCLGMNVFRDASSDAMLVGYGTDPSRGTWIELRPAGGSAAETSDPSTPSGVYWKIGITLPDLRESVSCLRRAGVEVSDPETFRDIGVMCHLADPEGFAIELLQHTFDGPRETSPGVTGAPELFAAYGTLGQITIRTLDIEANLAFYRDLLGLTLLSVQPVESHGFTLYFFAATEERAPDPARGLRREREWLWQRPYTLLEIQHLWSHDRGVEALRRPGSGAHGFSGWTWRHHDLEGLGSMLADRGMPFDWHRGRSALRLRDVNGIPIECVTHPAGGRAARP